MARAAIAAGADGLLVEVHPTPDKALSDGAQSLYPDQFGRLVREVGRHRHGDRAGAGARTAGEHGRRELSRGGRASERLRSAAGRTTGAATGPLPFCLPLARRPAPQE